MLDIQKIIGVPTIKTKEVDSKTTVFTVEYLPRGFWYTLWNSLRRLLVGYDYGWSITWMKVAWVSHEFSTLAWVKESIIDIMLNIKKLRFAIDDSVEPQTWLTLSFSWVQKYTSSDLKLPAWVELLTPDVELFSITDSKVKLNIDIRLERWYGYYSLNFLKKRELEKDAKETWLLLIDNDFQLVDSVSYEVEEVIEDFIGWMKDRLVLTVSSISDWVSPQQLLTFSWEVLALYAKLFIFDENYINEDLFIEMEELRQAQWHGVDDEIMNVKVMPIDALPLSERTRNALIKNDILYVEDLEKKSKNELLAMKWLWKKALDEINQSLDDIEKWLRQQ